MNHFKCRNCHYEFIEIPGTRYPLERGENYEDGDVAFSSQDPGEGAYCPSCNVAGGVLEFKRSSHYGLNKLEYDPETYGTILRRVE
jgi:rubredoxin